MANVILETCGTCEAPVTPSAVQVVQSVLRAFTPAQRATYAQTANSDLPGLLCPACTIVAIGVANGVKEG